MTGQNCSRDNVDAFERAMFQFCCSRLLVIFLLNIVIECQRFVGTLLFLLQRWCSPLLCLSVSDSLFKWWIWHLWKFFWFKFFLSNFHRHLYKNLKCLLLETDCLIACHLINRKYFYVHKDWFDGSVERFYLPYCLDIYENRKNEWN